MVEAGTDPTTNATINLITITTTNPKINTLATRLTVKMATAVEAAVRVRIPLVPRSALTPTQALGVFPRPEVVEVAVDGAVEMVVTAAAVDMAEETAEAVFEVALLLGEDTATADTAATWGVAVEEGPITVDR